MPRLVLLLALSFGCRREPCSECDPLAEYCVIAGSDISSMPSTSQCSPLPDECAGAPSCSCLESYAADEIPCESDCANDEVVTWTCPGG